MQLHCKFYRKAITSGEAEKAFYFCEGKKAELNFHVSLLIWCKVVSTVEAVGSD